MNESIGIQIERGLEAVNRLEAKVNGSMRCCDCSFVSEVTEHNGMGDGFCSKSDRVLVGFFKNGKTKQQPRKCRAHQPNRRESPKP